MGILGLLLALQLKQFACVLHLLQISHPRHVQDLTIVADLPILVPQGAELLVNVTFVAFGGGTRQPFDAGAIPIIFIVFFVLALQPAVLVIEGVGSTFQRLVPIEDSKDVICIV